MSRRLETVLIILILLVAAGLRFAHLDAIRFNIDHAYPVAQALKTLDSGALPLLGQASSVLFANPPLTGYLFIPALALTRSIVGVYVFVILLNTLGVWFCYRVTKETFDDSRLALIAAWLMAVNPWVIEYSRTTWVQSLLPFFLCAIAWLLFPVLLGKSTHPTRRLIAALVMVTVLTQTYLLAFLIVAPVGLLLLIFRKRIPLRGLLIGAGIFALATAVYAASLFAHPSAFQRAGNFTANAPHLSTEALSHALRLVTGAEYAAARSAILPDALFHLNAEVVVHYGLLVLVVVGVGMGVIAMFNPTPHPLPVNGEGESQLERRINKPAPHLIDKTQVATVESLVDSPPLASPGEAGRGSIALILLLWFFIPILAMSYTGNPVHPFYQLLGLPAGFMLAAWGASPLLKSRIGTTILTVGLLVTGLISGLNSLRYGDAVYLTPGKDYVLGLPVGDGLRLGAAMNEHLPEGGVVYSTFDATILNSFAGRLFPVVNDTRSPKVSIVPQRGGLYVGFYPPGEQPEQPPFSEPGATVMLADGYFFDVRVYPAGGADLSAIPNQLNIPSQEGITLCCYTLEQNTHGRWTLTTYWRVESANPLTSTDAFGTFAHLYNEAGENFQIVDGQIIPGYEWNTGDVHIHRMRFEVPQDMKFTVHIGQYDANQNRNVIFMLPDGQFVPTVTLSPGDASEPNTAAH